MFDSTRAVSTAESISFLVAPILRPVLSTVVRTRACSASSPAPIRLLRGVWRAALALFRSRRARLTFRRVCLTSGVVRFSLPLSCRLRAALVTDSTEGVPTIPWPRNFSTWVPSAFREVLALTRSSAARASGRVGNCLSAASSSSRSARLRSPAISMLSLRSCSLRVLPGAV